MLGSKVKAIDGEIVFASKAALSSVEQSKKVGLDCMYVLYVCMYSMYYLLLCVNARTSVCMHV